MPLTIESQIHLVFFGLRCLAIGYLIFRSTFLPRVLGMLMALAGMGWATYLSPPIASHLCPIIAAVAALAEPSLLLWLLLVGVNDQHREERARVAGASVRT